MNYTLEIDANGFGATYQATLYGLAYCRKNNLDFTYKPWSSIHSTSTSDCIKFIGFHKYPLPNNQTKYIEYNSELYNSPVDDLFTDNVLKEIRDNYYSTSKPRNPYSNYIAIHIRRGDVNKKKHPTRWVELNEYIKWIQLLKDKYPHFKIVILSEGNKSDFKEIIDTYPDIILDLNENSLRHFHIMVEANVLFPTLSSFSFTAGIINKNYVHRDIYDNYPFWHRPSSKCLSILHYVNIT
jgi:hypothetical protein